MRAKRERETSDYAAMVRRVIRAHGRRVADADDVDLTELANMQVTLDAAIQTAVDGMRARGESWAYIARAFGTTRQAAQMRYGKAAA